LIELLLLLLNHAVAGLKARAVLCHPYLEPVTGRSASNKTVPSESHFLIPSNPSI